MTDNLKRILPDDIDNLVAQVESLRRLLRVFKKKKFQTHDQKYCLAQPEIVQHLLRYYHSDPHRFEEHYGDIQDYFQPAGFLDKGRFVHVMGPMFETFESSETQPFCELYDPQRHDPSKKHIIRYDFDEKPC